DALQTNAEEDSVHWSAVDAFGLDAPVVAWHREREHAQLAHVVLHVQSRVLGVLCLAFRGNHQPSATSMEVVRILASQAAVAVQITRLAAQAQHAAVAREQERATRLRAAELAEANTALSRLTRLLTSLDELKPFLVGVIRESLRSSGAVSGSVSIYDRAGDAF